MSLHTSAGHCEKWPAGNFLGLLHQPAVLSCRKLGSFSVPYLEDPEGPSTEFFRLLVPKTILLLVLGTRDFKYWVLGPSRGSS